MKKVNNLGVILIWFSLSLSAENCDESDNANITVKSGNIDLSEEINLSFDTAKSFDEVLKLERDLAWAKQGLNMNDEELTTHLIRFYEYFKEYDRRRNLNFLETFPEMKEFWNEAKELYEEKYGS